MSEQDPSTSRELPTPLAPGVKRRIFAGIGAQTIALMLRVVQQLALVPIMIGGWGEAVFANWLALFSAASLLSGLDGGIQIYFGNALLIARAKDDDAAFRRRIAVAMGAYSVILCGAIAIMAVGLIGDSLNVPIPAEAMDGPAAAKVLMLLAAATLILTPFGLVTAIYRAYGDYGRAGAMSVSAEAVRGLAVCVVVLLGGTPVAAAGVFLAVAVMYWVIVVFDQRRRYGHISLAPAWPTAPEFKEGAVGSALYLAPTLASPIIINAPILLLGMFNEHPMVVVLFTVTRTFTGFVRQIVHQFSHPVGAELTRQQAEGADAALTRLYNTSGRRISGLAGLISGVTMTIAAPFIDIWTRSEVSADSWLTGVFLATIVLGAPSTVAQQLFQYNNRPGVFAIAHAANGVLAIGLCWSLIGSLGALGAAVAIGLAEVLTIGLFVTRAASASVAQPLSKYLASSFFAAVIGLALGAGAAFGWVTVLPTDTLAALALFGVVWTVTVTVPAFYLMMTAAERARLVGALRARLS